MCHRNTQSASVRHARPNGDPRSIENLPQWVIRSCTGEASSVPTFLVHTRLKKCNKTSWRPRSYHLRNMHPLSTICARGDRQSHASGSVLTADCCSAGSSRPIKAESTDVNRAKNGESDSQSPGKAKHTGDCSCKPVRRVSRDICLLP